MIRIRRNETRVCASPAPQPPRLGPLPGKACAGVEGTHPRRLFNAVPGFRSVAAACLYGGSLARVREYLEEIDTAKEHERA